MAFTSLDWIVLAAIVLLPLAVSLMYYRRAGP